MSAAGPLVLLGVVDGDGQGLALPAGVELVTVRDASALVTEAPAFRPATEPRDIERYRAVLETVARSRAVLPAPVGAVFRSRDSLVRWLELHYPTLADGLAFVADRRAARVHVLRPDGAGEPTEGSDLADAATQILRVLRRQAVASVPLATEHLTGVVLSAAFLVDRDLWKAFVEAVDEARSAHRDVEVQWSGPWPPYDFVRMQLGA